MRAIISISFEDLFYSSCLILSVKYPLIQSRLKLELYVCFCHLFKLDCHFFVKSLSDIMNCTSAVLMPNHEKTLLSMRINSVLIGAAVQL